MPEKTQKQPKKKKDSRNTIFWVCSGIVLILYVIVFPYWLYGKCSTPESLEEVIPGHIFISGQQTELNSHYPPNRSVGLAAIRKSVPTQQTIKQATEATYYPPKEPVVIWWRKAVCDVNSSDYLIGFFTLVLAISTFGLWWQTERLAEGADEQSKKMVEGINATLSIASATRDTISASRAWMTPEEIRHNLCHETTMSQPDGSTSRFDHGLMFSVLWKNTGTSPATHCQSITKYALIPATSIDVPHFLLEWPWPHSSGGVTGSGHTIGSPPCYLLGNESQTIGNEYKIVMSGAAQIIIYSAIRYFDVFEPKKVRVSEAVFSMRFDGYEQGINGPPRFLKGPVGTQNTAD